MSSRERDNFNEINITPLTDIFLVLLIIMMVIAPLLDQQGLNLMVPELVEEQQLQKDSKILTFFVSNDNRYFISEDQEISVSDLGNVIKQKSPEYPDGLMIEAAPDATHGAVVKLMDEARNAGITNISMAGES